MDKVYIASCFTVAHCAAAYSTAEQACAAIEQHYRALKNALKTEELGMRWVKLHNDYAWVPQDFNGEEGSPWAFNDTPDSLMEDCKVIEFDLDKPLPFV